MNSPQNSNYLRLEADASKLPPREKFMEHLDRLIGDKKSLESSNYFTAEQYARFLQETKEAQKSKKITKDFRRLKRFAVCTINGVDKLIVPPKPGAKSMQFFVTIDELFDVITEAHLAAEHKGRNIILPMVQEKYANVPRAVVQAYLDLCPTCLAKKKTRKRGLTVKPMVFHQMNDRWQIDLVDMQSNADGDFKWIFVCQDHLTKFIHLRPLTSNRSVEVAEHLLNIMLVFGAPSILQSDHGRDFCNAVIVSLRETWPELKIVHGTPRHSQSQGSVEWANQDIQNMLTAWMMTCGTTQWSKGLQYVASMKNRVIHPGTGRSPYEALFGSPMKVGITSSLPTDLVADMATEEELQEFLEGLEVEGGDGE